MVQKLIRDTLFLSQRSEDAAEADRLLISDLKDTRQANNKTCVGMAANMIGVKKRMIVVGPGITPMILINPKIIQKIGSYETKEGCLSLTGVRKTIGYRKITVEYPDEHFRRQK